MAIPSRARRGPGLLISRAGAGLAVLAVLLLTLISCTQPESDPAPPPGEQAPSPIELPERCRGDGAVQTWLLLPLDPPQSELMAAYQDRQVIEFQATVIGQDDSPALQPHRRFVLREAAEGITLLLDYQGDPPPLIQGQSYRIVAWAALLPAPEDLAAATPSADPRASIPEGRGYEVQVYDSAGLLFLGRTDVDDPGDPLGLQVNDATGECPAAPVPQNACVQSRQVLPATIGWDDAGLTLYPGEDGLLVHQGATYSAALFRNRQVIYADPPCADYSEHRRSLRIDRVDPLPVLPPLPPITGTLTTTLSITLTAPLTGTAPVDLVP